MYHPIDCYDLANGDEVIEEFYRSEERRIQIHNMMRKYFEGVKQELESLLSQKGDPMKITSSIVLHPQWNDLDEATQSYFMKKLYLLFFN